MKYNYLGFVLLILSISCGKEGNKQTKKVKPQSNFEKMLQAHGGLEQWNRYGTIEFDLYSKSDTVHHIVDLKSREELLQTNDYNVFFGKESLWIAPDKEAFGKDEPKFYRNLWFYFFSIPFVSADAGVNQSDLDTKSIAAGLFNGVKLTFGENVGDSPEDQYLLWLNSENDQLEWINYSVTYWNEENAEKYSALVYREWQEVGGLLVPKMFTGHKWQGDTIGAERYQFIFDNVKFSIQQPDRSLFKKPEIAFEEMY